MRIDEVRQLATQPAGANGQDQLTRVLQALNKAALIASDCGLAELARELCWRQFTVLRDAAPLPVRTASYTLEPIVNLGRLATRRGDGNGAYRLYEETFRAVTAGTAAWIDGHEVDFGNLIEQSDDRQSLRQFFQTVLLAEGTRALMTAHRWEAVLDHLRRYHGVGDRMLDGRQAAVLAHAACGHIDQALTMLDTATTEQLWEHAVAACLRALCLRLAGRGNDDAIRLMTDAFQAFKPDSHAVVFRVRLGLCVAEIAEITRPDASREIMAGLVRLAVQTGDGRAAVELRTHRLGSTYSASDEPALARITEMSGIEPRSIPPAMTSALIAAAEHALAVLPGLLGAA
jgi:hypothetical protein